MVVRKLVFELNSDKWPASKQPPRPIRDRLESVNDAKFTLAMTDDYEVTLDMDTSEPDDEQVDEYSQDLEDVMLELTEEDAIDMWRWDYV